MSGRILAATDESPGGRHAVSIAHRVASRTRSPLTVLRVTTLPPEGAVPAGRLVTTGPNGHANIRWPEALVEFEAKVRFENQTEPTPEVALAFGVPGIEIGRFATKRGTSLIVLGRRPRAPDHRLLLGETADALVRRAQQPILFVPEAVKTLSHVVAALDGSGRCDQVFDVARRFAREVGASLRAVTVEPILTDEVTVPGAALPQARSLRVREMLQRVAAAEVEPLTPLTVLRGDPIEAILEELERSQPDVLVVGYRRGGPPKRVGPTEIARNLLFAAPSAVLTVPL